MKRLRKKANLTQSDVAELLGIERSCIAKWENGDAFPRASQLPALAEALHCTIDELYAGDKDSA